MYVVGPLYLFSPFPEFNLGQLLGGLTLEIFIFWATNIFFTYKFPDWSKLQLYLGSAVAAFVLTLPKILFHPPLPFQNVIDKLLIYPLMTVVLVNSIIWIIINSVVGNFKMRAVEMKVEQLNIKNLEAQKQILLQQLQPHFLFNALSVLKSLIQENAEDAEDYVVKLSDFLRYSVDVHTQEVALLRNELQFTKDYIELQKVRFDNAFNFEETIPEAILDKKLPVFALQTLVENIFKHNHFTEKNPIRFSIQYEGDKIKIWNQRKAAKLGERNSTGLENLTKRYELITGKSIEIISDNDNFTVLIPLI
jgi:LytS/YehU family sensor histidine kinase